MNISFATIRQLAFVVGNIDEAMITIALACWGDQQIELIEQQDLTPRVYANANGQPAVGFHHLSSCATYAHKVRG